MLSIIKKSRNFWCLLSNSKNLFHFPQLRFKYPNSATFRWMEWKFYSTEMFVDWTKIEIDLTKNCFSVIFCCSEWFETNSYKKLLLYLQKRLLDTGFSNCWIFKPSFVKKVLKNYPQNWKKYQKHKVRVFCFFGWFSRKLLTYILQICLKRRPRYWYFLYHREPFEAFIQPKVSKQMTSTWNVKNWHDNFHFSLSIWGSFP